MPPTKASTNSAIASNGHVAQRFTTTPKQGDWITPERDRLTPGIVGRSVQKQKLTARSHYALQT